MKIGPWAVVPSQNLIARDGVSIKLEPRAMDLLVYLVRAAGRVTSADELLREVWRGRVFDESVVYKRINQLRKALGDDPHAPAFIETIPKRGYRLIAAVAEPAAAPSAPAESIEPPGRSPANVAAAAAGFSLRLRRLALLGGVAAMLVALTGVAFLRERPPAPRGPLTFEPFEFQRDGSELLHARASTVWSPTGDAVAFAAQSRTEPGPPLVYVRYLASPTSVPFPRIEGLPKAWTPDGHLLINRSRGPFATSESAGLWTVSTVGGATEHYYDFAPGTMNIMSVSRDGANVAALRRGEDDVIGIWTARLPDGELVRYEPAPFASTGFSNIPSLSFSPDGRQLLLMWNRGAGEEIWLMPFPADPTHPPRRIFEDLPTFATPTFSWLPDNRHIVVSSAAPNRPLRLYLADTVSSRFRLLADGVSSAQQIEPVVSPDGERLLFAELNVDLDIVTLDVATLELATVMATNRVEQMPVWSTEVGGFAYVVDRDGDTEIWLREANGNDRLVVSARDFPPGTTRYLMGPRLSPDGRHVAYRRTERSSVDGGAALSRVWVSPLSGGSPMRLTDRSMVESVGYWSPDGSWFVHTAATGRGGTLIKTRLSQPPESVTLVSEMAPSRIPPVWSPDGRFILYDDDGLKLISAAGEPIRSFDLKDALCAFARTEPLLYCVVGVFGTGASFVAVNLDGSMRVIGPIGVEDLPFNMGGPSLLLSLTPDGRGVTYSVNRTRMELLLLEGLASAERP